MDDDWVRPYKPAPEFVPRYYWDTPRRVFLVSREIRGWTDVEIPLASAPSLVSSALGPISEVLFTVPRWAFEHDQYWNVYQDLFTALPGNTRFVVLVQKAAASALQEWIAEVDLGERCTVLAGPDDINFSIWAEDAYVFVRDSDGTGHFVEPFMFRRRGDALIADLVTRGTTFTMYQAPLYFQGGNVLVGDDFFLIGRDYVNETFRHRVLNFTEKEGESDEARRERWTQLLLGAYREYLDATRAPKVLGSRLPVPPERVQEFARNGQRWTEEVYRGNMPGTVQPLFHIDMFITLVGRTDGGRFALMVGDPRQAAEILDIPLSRYAMPEVFDDIAGQLAEDGFEVIRNPLPLVFADDEENRVRSWYFATANNALVEATASSKSVWLPTYGHRPWSRLRATDLANKRIWEGLGFNVHMLPDFHPFASGLGAVHCIKKYLARGS